MATSAIRSASTADWPSIAALLRDNQLPLDGAEAHIADFVVAEREGRTVGCAAVERYDDVGLLRSVAVESMEQGRGTGTALVETAVARARSKGIVALTLLTTTAESYFRRFGFVRVDVATVPQAVHASVEFRGACPASAIAMILSIVGAGAEGSRRQVNVRVATVADAPVIADIYNAGIQSRVATFETRQRTPSDVESWFDPRFPMLVAETDGRVAGWIAASTYRSRECYAGIAEFSVYVEPSMRRRGIADALMSDFLPALERLGFWKVLSRIFPANAASLALCRRHGFRIVGVYERHGRLDGAWRDCVIVERLLGAARTP